MTELECRGEKEMRMIKEPERRAATPCTLCIQLKRRRKKTVESFQPPFDSTSLQPDSSQVQRQDGKALLFFSYTSHTMQGFAAKFMSTTLIQHVFSGYSFAEGVFSNTNKGLSGT